MILFLEIICISSWYLVWAQTFGVYHVHITHVSCHLACNRPTISVEKDGKIFIPSVLGKQQHDRDTNRRNHKSWDMSIFQIIHCSILKQHDIMDAFHLLPQAFTSTQTPAHSFPFPPHFISSVFFYQSTLFLYALCLEKIPRLRAAGHPPCGTASRDTARIKHLLLRSASLLSVSLWRLE